VPFAGCIIHGERYTGLAVTWWRRYIRGSVCQVVHGVDPFLTQVSNTKRALNLFRDAGRACDAVILVGRPLSAHAVSIGLPADRLHVVANGTDLPLLAASADAQRTLDELRRVISVSNLIELKGIDDNLRALAQIAMRRPDLAWEYRVVGDGIERLRLETLAQELGIADKVHFLGRIPYCETMREVAEADIFSLPSWGEAFGIVYLEAMARMRPVIGCLANGAEDIITHDHDGLLVTPHSVAELSNALERLIASPELSQQLGRNARITAEGYSWDRNAQRMLELLGIEI
jgi:glycosyltransferase involved in cell wall biosynthesis